MSARTGKQFTDAWSKPAVGYRTANHVKLVCAIDPETFATVRDRAVKKKTSVAEQVRILIEWGLEAESQ